MNKTKMIILEISLVGIVIYMIVLGFSFLKTQLHNSILYLSLLSVLAFIGYYIEKLLEKLFLSQFMFFFKDSEEFPKVTNFMKIGLQLSFIFSLAAVGISPITDLVNGTPPNFSINYIFYDLAIVIAFFTIVIVLIIIIIKNIFVSLDKEQENNDTKKN